MKKTIITMLIAGMCVVSLVGCGHKSSDKQNETKKETNVEKNDTKKNNNKNTSKKMTREEVLEKYFKPMEELKSNYEVATDPSEIEKTAKEYNELALKGREAYIAATGSAPKIELFPRREYLAKMAFYNVVQECAADYEEMFVAYTATERSDEYAEKYNPNPRGIISRSDDEQIAEIDPEDSDSLVYLVNYERNDKGQRWISNVLIIKDGGKSKLEVNIEDYTEEQVSDLLVSNEHIALMSGMSFKLYSYSGRKLKLEEEYFNFENVFHAPHYGYSNQRYEGYSHGIDEDALHRAENDLHLKLDE